MPNSLAILAASFEGPARGRAIGTWAAVGAAAGALGPLAGGWLIDALGWRTMFLVNLPIALAAIVMALKYVQDQRLDSRPALDAWGAMLISAALAALTWALTVASERAALTGPVLGALAAGAALIAGFIAVEWRRGERAMLPLSLFSSMSFVGLSLLTLLLYGALGGVFVLIPYVLIEVKHYSATAAGAALLPLPLIIAIASPTMGRIAGSIGARLPLTIGPMIVAAGLWLATRVVAEGSYWTTTLPAMVLIAVGMAGAVAPLTTAVFAAVEKAHAGVASGFNSAIARTGGLIATALLGGIFAARGVGLNEHYRFAVLVGAASALAAGLIALVSIGRPPR
jgi:MFS family permease